VLNIKNPCGLVQIRREERIREEAIRKKEREKKKEKKKGIMDILYFWTISVNCFAKRSKKLFQLLN
jgi:hypothetical protein